MKHPFTISTRRALWLVIFVLTMLCQGQNANAQWWKDTVWTKKTDQVNGFYMLKFSKNDSIIVGHGYEMDLFYDAASGNEIKRIPGNNEVHYFNNDLNFLRLNEDDKTIEIWDAKAYKVIDSLESDDKKIEKIEISKDEKTVIAVTGIGLRKWDLETKKIIKSINIDIPEQIGNYYFWSKGFHNIRITNDLTKAIVSFYLVYSDLQKPKSTSFAQTYEMIYDYNTLDTIGRFVEGTGFTFRLSNTNKYLASKTNNNGNNGLEIYDFNTKQLLWQIPLNPSTITGYEFSPDDKYLVTSSNNAEYGLQIWDINKQIINYEYPKGSYSNITINTRGNKIAFSTGRYLMLLLSHFDDVSVNGSENLALTLYPNPTTNAINLSFEIKTPQILNYTILNEKGQIIKPLLDEFTNTGTIIKTFDVSDIPTGTYFLKITGADFGLTFKLMVVK